jgi:hypothetical protein
VGSPSTFVCRLFQRLGDERAAVVLIHEALHHAGLTEYPQDPEAMTSGADGAETSTHLSSCANLSAV